MGLGEEAVRASPLSLDRHLQRTLNVSHRHDYAITLAHSLSNGGNYHSTSDSESPISDLHTSINIHRYVHSLPLVGRDTTGT